MEMPNDSIEKIHEEVVNCKSCDLCKSRTNAVPGDGALSEKLQEGMRMRKVDHLWGWQEKSLTKL